MKDFENRQIRIIAVPRNRAAYAGLIGAAANRAGGGQCTGGAAGHGTDLRGYHRGG
ncbi:MAG: hypothetical protein ACLVFA_02195 [Butyricicoccus sp.]